MFDIGRVCVKIAGRDAGKTCVIVEQLEGGLVVIDGQTRRRKCNVRHLEPTTQVLEIKTGSDHAAVKAAFAKMNVDVLETKPKTAGKKPTKEKAKKVVAEKPKKAEKKEPAPVKEPAAKAPVSPQAEPTVENKED